MKSGGLLGALAIALALLAGLVWWLGREERAPAEAAGGTRLEKSTSEQAPPVRIDAPNSSGSSATSSAPQQREARGTRAYLVPQGPRGALQVRVTWELTGAAAANVGVRLERMDGPLLLLQGSARTDANGVALFDDVAAGLLLVRGDRSGEVVCDVVEGRRNEVELKLAHGVTVTGRVRDEQGRSVSQGTVWILARSRWIELAEADASGRYTVESVPVDSTLVALARERSPSRWSKVEGAVEGVVQLDFEVGGPAATLLGQVLDPGENPVTRAAVVLLSREQGAAGLSAPPRRAVACDEEGRFQLHSVPPGPQRLLVQTEQFAPEVRDVEVRLGERQELIIQVSPGAELAGVVTLQGKPAPGALVLVGSEFGTAWGGAASDAAGRYRITGLPTGKRPLVAALAPGPDNRLRWLENTADADLASASAELELVAGRAVIWNPELKTRD